MIQKTALLESSVITELASSPSGLEYRRIKRECMAASTSYVLSLEASLPNPFSVFSAKDCQDCRPHLVSRALHPPYLSSALSSSAFIDQRNLIRDRLFREVAPRRQEQPPKLPYEAKRPVDWYQCLACPHSLQKGAITLDTLILHLFEPS